MRVLILRPAPGDAATAGAIAAMGLEPVVVPLFEIVPLAWAVPDGERFDVLVMTSANAVRFGGEGLAALHHLPVLAVGESTAAAARAAGFAEVTSGPGDARDLGDMIGARTALHLAGEDSVPLPCAGPVTTIAVYAARARVLSASEQGRLGCPVAMVHSPRAGRVFAAVSPDRAGTIIVAISEAAALACGPGWREIVVAAAPREAAMLASVARLCEADATN